VLAQLNSNTDPQAMLASLPYRRLVMEANTPVGPVKLMWDTATARLTAADIPHFSKFFCLRVAQAAGVNTNTAGQDMSTGEYTGAVTVYAWIVSQPLNRMHFMT
jgi:hypothetical protein